MGDRYIKNPTENKIAVGPEGNLFSGSTTFIYETGIPAVSSAIENLKT